MEVTTGTTGTVLSAFFVLGASFPKKYKIPIEHLRHYTGKDIICINEDAYGNFYILSVKTPSLFRPTF
jgi:hypothetical protein